jgi:lysophospholipase L1-like esterase
MGVWTKSAGLKGCALVAAALAIGASATSSAESVRTLHAVAIGDSLPYGQRDCGGCPTFIVLFGKALARATGAQVEVRNLSEHTGIDSSDLRAELVTSLRLRSVVAAADVVTVTIGHNDPPWNSYDDSCDATGGYPDAHWAKYNSACLTSNVARYAMNLDAILKEVRRLRAGKATLVRVTNDYDDLIGDPQVPTSAYPIVKRFVDAYGKRTCRIARKYGAVCIDTYHAFNGPAGTRDAGPWLGPDHTHPNARGHRLIAQLLVRAGFAPLR